MAEKQTEFELRQTELGSVDFDTAYGDEDKGMKSGTSEDAVDMHRLGKKQEFKARETAT
jgi:hypothetical protein